MGKLTSEYEYRVLDRPDCYIDLNNSYFLVSSAGEGDEERLQFFVDKIFPYWSESQCSLHQLANYLKQFNIELTHHDHQNSTQDNLPTNLVGIWMYFQDQNNKAILVQGIATSSSNLQ